ncbi:MAG: PorV/PorQ family protein [Flavipsychrobacter sp.]|nr:PorV/PorQ family protein [Flavipsychrobacter sp.]
MKHLSISAILLAGLMGVSVESFAGNKDRTGQAGATELLINPWAQSTGVFGMNTAYVTGVEAMKNNIAGLAESGKLDIGLSHGVYLTGSNITINDAAISAKLGNVGVVGLNVMSMGFGDITITDYNNPEGTGGTYHPQFLNVELGFAKEFSNSIRAGAAATYVSEQVGSISATGACFEAGVQYITGKDDNFHFGITLRNLGTNMRFSGNGFSINGENPQAAPTFSATTTYPSDLFPMPTYLNLGLSYDFYLDQEHRSTDTSSAKHKLTVMGDFQSNSFNNDNLGLGLEYWFMNMVGLRAAYRYENGIGNSATSTTLYTGLAAGVTLQTKLGSSGPMLSVDYSYRPTQRPANGVHMFSLRFSHR